MAQNVSLWGATYSNVPALEVPKQGGGTATFTDVTDTTAGASDVASGKYFYTAAGVKTAGTGSGGGGGSSVQVGYGDAEPQSATTTISFMGIEKEPTSFVVYAADELTTGASPFKVATVVYDGTNVIGQIITNTNNAQVSYDSSSFSYSYDSDGDILNVYSTSPCFQPLLYFIVYSYDGTAGNVKTADVQVGSGATSITFTGLEDEPLYWSCIFKSNFSTSNGYQRVVGVIGVVEEGENNIAGLEMDSSAKFSDSHWTSSYNNGSLTITSQGTNAGGYFHQPGYYQLTYGVGGEAPAITTEPLSVTVNGTYTAPAGKAYTPVTVNVSGGGTPTVKTTTKTNSSNTATSISFTGLTGQPVAFFVRCATQMQSSSTTYYYVSNMRYNGTNVNGNAFRMGSTRQVTVVTSGYSYSYNNGTLTVSSSGNRTTAPGSFYNGTYELVYVY